MSGVTFSEQPERAQVRPAAASLISLRPPRGRRCHIGRIRAADEAASAAPAGVMTLRSLASARM